MFKCPKKPMTKTQMPNDDTTPSHQTGVLSPELGQSSSNDQPAKEEKKPDEVNEEAKEETKETKTPKNEETRKVRKARAGRAASPADNIVTTREPGKPEKVTAKKKQVAMTKAKGVTAQRKRKVNEGTKEALLRLQKLRVGGTWAMCTLPACSKWRYLSDVLDPAEVGDQFTCRDCKDPNYSSCEAPEQDWDTDLASHSVETRFTVGSLVWAKMNGFPAWPAMVDDDPDTGEFFWTERLGWQEKPSQYHVTFFDDKVVRKWVACSRLSKFDQKKPNIPRTARGSRLLKAFTRAVEASKESLEVRREKYCFAQLYKGKWGPVWDECGSERVDLHLDVGAGNISHNVRSLRDRGAVAGRSSQFESPNKLSSKSQPCQEVAESSRTKTDNENLLPLLQELANQQGLSQDSELLTVSFGEVDEDEALTKQIGEFILDTKLFTPIKRSGPERCDGVSPCKSLLLTSTPVKPETPLSL